MQTFIGSIIKFLITNQISILRSSSFSISYLVALLSKIILKNSWRSRIESCILENLAIVGIFNLRKPRITSPRRWIRNSVQRYTIRRRYSYADCVISRVAAVIFPRWLIGRRGPAANKPRNNNWFRQTRRVEDACKTANKGFSCSVLDRGLAQPRNLRDCIRARGFLPCHDTTLLRR